MKFWGKETCVDVVSYNDEFKVQVHAVARSLRTCILAELWGERSFTEGFTVLAGTAVAADFVKASAAFREPASERAIANESKTCDEINHLLCKKRKWFQTLDRYNCIEQTLFEWISGKAAARHVEASILAALPQPDSGQTIAETVAKFKKIAESKMLEFAGPLAQQVVGEADSLLHAIKSDRLLKFPVCDSEYMTALQAGFARLASSEGQDSDNEQVVPWGQEAGNGMFNVIDDKKTPSLPCAVAAITFLITFGWLSTAEQHTATQKWALEVLAAVSVRS